ncbi:hypothetical protein HDV05_005719 [Chytridiales sp. JEL 0842]|nr:hypothetical protein HDV05_005719 [Chytridiales sp. JEL 0842]
METSETEQSVTTVPFNDHTTASQALSQLLSSNETAPVDDQTPATTVSPPTVKSKESFDVSPPTVSMSFPGAFPTSDASVIAPDAEPPSLTSTTTTTSLDHSSIARPSTPPSLSDTPTRQPSSPQATTRSSSTSDGTPDQTVRIDILSRLPSEMSIKILGYLRGPKTLARCAAVNRTWNRLANDELNWKALCFLRWSTKQHIAKELHTRVDYSSLIQRLTIKEMKGILQSRKVDTRGLMEKSEFQERIINTLPKNSPDQTGIIWRSKWKASFVVAELDSKRTILTKDELCSLRWTFRLMYPEWPADRLINARFFPDYSYESDMPHGPRKMSWRFYLNDIQVEQYPALSVHRDKNWGYILTNQMAIFHSYPSSPPPPMSHPHPPPSETLKLAAEDVIHASHPIESPQADRRKPMPIGVVSRSTDVQVGRIHYNPDARDALVVIRLMAVLTITLIAVVVINVFFIFRNSSQSSGPSVNQPPLPPPSIVQPRNSNDNGPVTFLEVLSQSYALGIAMLFVAWGFSFHTLSHLMRLHYDMYDGGAVGAERGTGVLRMRRITMAGTSALDEVDPRVIEDYNFNNRNDSNNNNRNVSINVSSPTLLKKLQYLSFATLSALGLSGVVPGLGVYRLPNGSRNLQYFGKWSDGEPDFMEVNAEIQHAESRASLSTSVTQFNEPQNRALLSVETLNNSSETEAGIRNRTSPVPPTSPTRSSFHTARTTLEPTPPTPVTNDPTSDPPKPTTYPADPYIIRLPMATSQSVHRLRIPPAGTNSDTGGWTVADMGGVCVAVSSTDSILPNIESPSMLNSPIATTTAAEREDSPVDRPVPSVYPPPPATGTLPRTRSQELVEGVLWDISRSLLRNETSGSSSGVGPEIRRRRGRRDEGRVVQVLKEEDVDAHLLRLVLGE